MNRNKYNDIILSSTLNDQYIPKVCENPYNHDNNGQRNGQNSAKSIPKLGIFWPVDGHHAWPHDPWKVIGMHQTGIILLCINDTIGIPARTMKDVVARLKTVFFQKGHLTLPRKDKSNPTWHIYIVSLPNIAWTVHYLAWDLCLNYSSKTFWRHLKETNQLWMLTTMTDTQR